MSLVATKDINSEVSVSKRRSRGLIQVENTWSDVLSSGFIILNTGHRPGDL